MRSTIASKVRDSGILWNWLYMCWSRVKHFLIGMFKGQVMARKLIDTIENGTAVAKVYRDSEWDEYVVDLEIDEIEQHDCGYSTDNKEDAINTAHVMVGL
jgi:ribonuclease HII